MGNIISSRKNPHIQFIDKLKKRAARDQYGAYIVEGLRELKRAYQTQHLREIYFCPHYFSSQEHGAFLQQLSTKSPVPQYEVSAYAFEKISLREGMDGFIGIGIPLKTLKSDLQQLVLFETPLILVAESIEKPGNLGAILRSADSAGVNAVVLLDPRTDLYNPNCIRASQGAIFSIPIILSYYQEWEYYCREKEWQWVVMTPHAESHFWSIDMKRPTAIILGSEKDGLRENWFRHPSSRMVKIPHHGISDSLNVSVATAIVLYEAVRQRTLYPSVNALSKSLLDINSTDSTIPEQHRR
ncbi:MAG: RNA methyltransferase [Puniceicoccales bacterium]|jgi:TrmH family RNA methyltransferase|nr:RNA methyltransferase [Puniceicoccales bacterium]